MQSTIQLDEVDKIIDGIGCEQIKVSQYLKRLRDDGFVTA